MIDPHLATACYVSKNITLAYQIFLLKSLLVILMFPLLIESFLSRGSIEISMMVALGHCFLAEIPDSVIPLTSCSQGSWSRCFFWKE